MLRKRVRPLFAGIHIRRSEHFAAHLGAELRAFDQ
jgi:hypothetical protein